MTKAPKVLLLIESSRGFGRSLLTGIAEYARFNGPWSIFTFPPFFREPMNMKRLLKRMVQSRPATSLSMARYGRSSLRGCWGR